MQLLAALELPVGPLVIALRACRFGAFQGEHGCIVFRLPLLTGFEAPLLLDLERKLAEIFKSTSPDRAFGFGGLPS
jgi:hypothetical protein